MGSYLHIYIKSTKNTNNLINVASFRTSSSEFYQCLNEVTNLTYDKYITLSSSDIQDVLNSINKEINNLRHILCVYYKTNDASVDEILSMEDFLENRISMKGQFELLYNIITDIELGFTDIDEVLCKIS